MQRGAAVGLGVALAVRAVAATADEPARPKRPAAVLEFRSTSTEPSCPTERDFRDHVVGRLGFDPFVASAPRTLVVTLYDDKKKVHADVVLRGATALGKRELEANRNECGELGDSVAIAVSMILDPLGVAASLPPADEPPSRAPPPPPEVVTGPVAPDRPAPPPPAEGAPRIQRSIEVAPQLSIGRGPNVTLGARLDGAVWSGPWGLGIEGMIESTAGYVTTGAEQARGLFAAGGVLACHRRPWLFGCVIGSLGLAEGEVRGLEGTRRTFASWAGVRIGVPMCSSPSLCIEPAVDLLANVVRSRFHANGADVWTAPVLAATFGIAVAFRP